MWSTIAKTYFLERPIFGMRSSEKNRTILDPNNNIVGYVGRFYDNPWQKIFSFLVPGAFTHVKALDAEGNTRVLIRMIANGFAFFKGRWKVTVYSGNTEYETTMDFRPVSLGNKQYNLEFDGREVVILDTTPTSMPQFYDSNNNLLVKCSAPLSDTLHIQILDRIIDPDVDPYLVAGICYINVLK